MNSVHHFLEYIGYGEKEEVPESLRKVAKTYGDNYLFNRNNSPDNGVKAKEPEPEPEPAPQQAVVKQIVICPKNNQAYYYKKDSDKKYYLQKGLEYRPLNKIQYLQI